MRGKKTFARDYTLVATKTEYDWEQLNGLLFRISYSSLQQFAYSILDEVEVNAHKTYTKYDLILNFFVKNSFQRI